MVFFNYTTMQVTAKIVYYGPGLCGKTTNLQQIHQKTAPRSRGEMVSLETETDRTLFFDLLPLEVGVIGGMKVRLQLYTVPGQVFYNATRKLVLKSVDGIVFVADSQLAALEANLESLRNLETNLAELGMGIDRIPSVFQYNKRDIRNIHTLEKLNEALNTFGIPYYEAAALHGVGVFETLKGISRLALTSVRQKLAEENAKRRPPGTLVTVAAAAAPVPQAPTPPPAPPRELVPLAGSPEDLELEFAEEDHDKVGVHPVPTRGRLDIQKRLEELRAVAAAPAAKSAPVDTAQSVERRLRDILASERQSRHEVKRKGSVEVPGHLLKGSSAMKIQLAFEDGEGQEEIVKDALTVRLTGNPRLERLTMHIELELKSKG